MSDRDRASPAVPARFASSFFGLQFVVGQHSLVRVIIPRARRSLPPSLSLPLAPCPFFGGYTMVGMDFSFAHSTPPQLGTLLTTATTSAFTLPSSMAACSARRFDPPPDTNTATLALPPCSSPPAAAAALVERRRLESPRATAALPLFVVVVDVIAHFFVIRARL